MINPLTNEISGSSRSNTIVGTYSNSNQKTGETITIVPDWQAPTTGQPSFKTTMNKNFKKFLKMLKKPIRAMSGKESTGITASGITVNINTTITSASEGNEMLYKEIRDDWQIHIGGSVGGLVKVLTDFENARDTNEAYFKLLTCTTDKPEQTFKSNWDRFTKNSKSDEGMARIMATALLHFETVCTAFKNHPEEYAKLPASIRAALQTGADMQTKKVAEVETAEVGTNPPTTEKPKYISVSTMGSNNLFDVRTTPFTEAEANRYIQYVQQLKELIEPNIGCLVKHSCKDLGDVPVKLKETNLHTTNAWTRTDHTNFKSAVHLTARALKGISAAKTYWPTENMPQNIRDGLAKADALLQTEIAVITSNGDTRHFTLAEFSTVRLNDNEKKSLSLTTDDKANINIKTVFDTLPELIGIFGDYPQKLDVETSLKAWSNSIYTEFDNILNKNS